LFLMILSNQNVLSMFADFPTLILFC
jgi:hypothetical protein